MSCAGILIELIINPPWIDHSQTILILTMNVVIANTVGLRLKKIEWGQSVAGSNQKLQWQL